MKVKKIVSVMMGAVLCAGLMAGCGGNSDGSGAADSSKGGGNSSTLSMMCVGTTADAYLPGYKKVIEDFNANNESGVTVTCDFISNSDYKTKLTTLMASDSEPDIIFTWELGYLEPFVNGNKVVSLQSYLDQDTQWKDSFNGGMLEQLTYNGEVYAIPTQQSMAVMYYNKAMFDQCGLSVPSTYEEYRNCCDTLLANGITPVALASTPDDAWLVSQYIQQLANGIAGYNLYDSLKNKEGAWNDPAFIQAGQLLAEEVEAGYFEDGFTGVSDTESKMLFQKGQTAMYFNGCWETGNLNNAEFCDVYEDVSCFAMPPVDAANANISVGSVDTSFAVTANCKNVDAAVEFLKYWTSADVAGELLYKYGRLPSTGIELDETKLDSLTVDCISCFEQQSQLTPWFDRMDTDMGNEFNNTSVSISNGDDPQKMFDALEDYAKSR